MSGPFFVGAYATGGDMRLLLAFSGMKYVVLQGILTKSAVLFLTTVFTRNFKDGFDQTN